MRLTRILGAAGAILAIATLATAQIERLDLRKMVAKTDGAVFGEIVGKEVIRIDHPIDGPELYFTHLTVEGRSLVDGEPRTLVVTFAGGFVDDEHGVHNSEAPSDDDTQLGREVVVFHKWSDNMGGDLAANALYAAHGGLYRTVEGRQGTIVLGRGDGYAVSQNVKLAELDSEITALDREIRQNGK